MVAHEEEARRKSEIQEKREREDEEDSTDVTGERQERPGRDPHTYRSLCLDVYMCVGVKPFLLYSPPPLLRFGLGLVLFSVEHLDT